jgi:hypothetical protein
MTISDFDIENFKSNGFLVIKNVIPGEQVLKLRGAFEVIRKKSRKAGNTLYDSKYPEANFLRGDLTSFRELEPFDFLVFNQDIVNVVKALIGEEVVYFGESNTQSGLAVRGNHKDNRVCDRENPSGLDWQGDYPLVRVAIYLNDSDYFSGGVKIMPGSHNIPTSHFRGGGINVDAKAGDLVIWKLTTTHSGNAKRLKFFRNISFHPRIENFIPPALERLSPLERRAMFIVYGAPGLHLERYIKYLADRPDTRAALRLAGTSERLRDLAHRCAVKLRYPTHDYGADVNSSGFQFD